MLKTSLIELSKKGLFSVQTARFKRKMKVAQFRVFELNMEGHTLTATFRQPFDLLAITNTTWQKRKAAGVDLQRPSSKSWLPTLDNLRNLLLRPTTEMRSFFQQSLEAR